MNRDKTDRFSGTIRKIFTFSKLFILSFLVISFSGCVSIQKTTIVSPIEDKFYSKILVLFLNEYVTGSDFSEFETLNRIQNVITSENNDKAKYSEGKQTGVSEDEEFLNDLLQKSDEENNSSKLVKTDDLVLSIPLISKEDQVDNALGDNMGSYHRDGFQKWKNGNSTPPSEIIHQKFKDLVAKNGLNGFLFLTVYKSSSGTPVTSGSIDLMGSHATFESSTSTEYTGEGYTVIAEIYDATTEKIVWKSSFWYFGNNNPYSSFAAAILNDLNDKEILKK